MRNHDLNNVIVLVTAGVKSYPVLQRYRSSYLQNVQTPVNRDYLPIYRVAMFS